MRNRLDKKQVKFKKKIIPECGGGFSSKKNNTHKDVSRCTLQNGTNSRPYQPLFRHNHIPYIDIKAKNNRKGY